jgi:hypothetical protein
VSTDVGHASLLDALCAAAAGWFRACLLQLAAGVVGAGYQTSVCKPYALFCHFTLRVHLNIIPRQLRVTSLPFLATSSLPLAGCAATAMVRACS